MCGPGDDSETAHGAMLAAEHWMFDVRTSRTNAIFEELMDEHRRRLLKTIIFKSESLNQANLVGKPVSQYLPHSRGAFDYESLCDEILRLRPKPR